PDAVTLLTTGQADDEDEERRPHARQVTRRELVSALDLDGGVKDRAASDVSVTNDDIVVGGRSFRCQRLGYSARDPLGADEYHMIWRSDAVKTTGVVRERMTKKVGGLTLELEATLEAYGTESGEEWPALPKEKSGAVLSFEAPEEKASDYYPLEAGMQWQYDYSELGAPVTPLIYILKDVKADVASFDVALMATYVNADTGEKTQRGSIANHFKATVWNGEPCLVGRSSVSGSTQFDPPQTLVHLGDVGTTWTWTGDVTEKKKGVTSARKASVSFKLEAEESVTVRFGTFTCWRVLEGHGEWTRRRWYAKGIGMVKEVTVAKEGTSTMELVWFKHK
ncbi:MAG TPA: hypothetical protein VFF73_19535, partial [Planctomycetota bacterium]|nr:hypothetical protein [Planctomycetota bacterium]